MSRPGPTWTWVLAVALALVGVAAVLLRPTAPVVPDVPVAEQLTTFAPDVLARVRAWVGPIRIAFVLRTLLTLALPVLLVATGSGQRVVERLGRGRLPTLRGVVVPQVVALVAALPFIWWISWRHAGDFGFRTAGPVRFVVETAGQLALGMTVTTITVLLLLWLVRARPYDWPAVGALLGTVLSAALVVAYPLVVNRVLYDPQPLEDPAVAAAVQPVIERSDLPATELLVGEASVRTTRVNAFVSGLGPSRQVVLWDTLLELPERRVAAVVGHEVAHAEHGDLLRGVLASGTGILVALVLAQLVLRRRGDVPLRGARAGSVAVVVVLVAQFLGEPVVAWQSRRVEAAADARALELVRDPAGQVALQRGFVTDDLSDPAPPLWVELLSSHPTVADRIRRAAAFGVAEGLDPVPDELAGEQ